MPKKETLCWHCRRSTPDAGEPGCVWIEQGEPVCGWHADKTCHSGNLGHETSYCVYSCPFFQRHQQRDNSCSAHSSFEGMVAFMESILFRAGEEYIIALKRLKDNPCDYLRDEVKQIERNLRKGVIRYLLPDSLTIDDYIERMHTLYL